MIKKIFIALIFMLTVFSLKNVNAVYYGEYMDNIKSGVKYTPIGYFTLDTTDDKYYSQKYMVSKDRLEILNYKIESLEGFPKGSFIANTDTGEKQTEFEANELKFKIMVPKEAIEKDFIGKINTSLSFKAVNIYYTKDDKIQTQYIWDTNKQTVNLDYRNSNITVKVMDSDTMREIKGVNLEFEDAFNIKTKFNTKDNNGYAYIGKIGEGQMHIKILEIPDDYVLENSEYALNVEHKEQKYFEIALKHKKGKLHITDNAKKATFQIYDSDINLIGVYETNENGEIDIEELNTGKYLLIQKDVDEAYFRDENKYFTISENETCQVDIINLEKPKIEQEETDTKEDKEEQDDTNQQEEKEEELQGTEESKEEIEQEKGEAEKEEEQDNIVPNEEKEEESKNTEESKDTEESKEEIEQEKGEVGKEQEQDNIVSNEEENKKEEESKNTEESKDTEESKEEIEQEKGEAEKETEQDNIVSNEEEKEEEPKDREEPKEEVEQEKGEIERRPEQDNIVSNEEENKKEEESKDTEESKYTEEPKEEIEQEKGEAEKETEQDNIVSNEEKEEESKDTEESNDTEKPKEGQGGMSQNVESQGQVFSNKNENESEKNDKENDSNKNDVTQLKDEQIKNNQSQITVLPKTGEDYLEIKLILIGLIICIAYVLYSIIKQTVNKQSALSKRLKNNTD